MIKVFNEMTPERLAKIRNVLINEIYTNPSIMLNDTIRGDDLADEIELIRQYAVIQKARQRVADAAAPT